MHTTACIIAVAGASHYLVAARDVKGNISPIPPLARVVRCKSLLVAKQLLRKNKFQRAELILHSAFDEMCGLAPPALAKQILNL